MCFCFVFLPELFQIQLWTKIYMRTLFTFYVHSRERRAYPVRGTATCGVRTATGRRIGSRRREDWRSRKVTYGTHAVSFVFFDFLRLSRGKVVAERSISNSTH